jgi:hypothetical protein
VYWVVAERALNLYIGISNQVRFLQHQFTLKALTQPHHLDPHQLRYYNHLARMVEKADSVKMGNPGSNPSSMLTMLSLRLSELATTQQALLMSLSHTHNTLSTLPSYNCVAPVLSAIPEYNAKLSRLRRAMAQQQRDVESLKRRAAEAAKHRRDNLARIQDLRGEERVRDRTVLLAKEVGAVVGNSDGTSASGTTISSPGDITGSVQGAAVRVVKKRKKARKVEIL